jgi:cytochrome c-type biogenesis protein CcmF
MIDLSLLGSASVWLALAVALYAIVAGTLGATRRDARLITSARYAAVGVFLALTAAVLTLETALLTDDFSVSYVADHSRLASPTWVKVVTLWAALDGSLLFWGWLLSGYTAAVAIFAPNTPLRPWALTVMQVVQVFFVGVVATLANPFDVVAVPPADGRGPNPLLQNHWMMAVHPALLYLGYVGLTVPYAFAMAALITRRPGTEWMTQTRFWTLTGWGFLSAGIIAGGWWSYEVLGWGGYWAWDPVENVSFMPWLTATAFIHSVQVQERRRMLKSWNVLLIILTFALSILGTFLIRSGVISSVHSFGVGPIGPAFLAFFGVVALLSFGLVAWRWDQVRDTGELDAAVSREGAFLAANVLFLLLTFAVLLGTLFPLLVEAVSGSRVTVGAPFFDQVSAPLWLLVLALMGIGPLLPWRKAETQSLKRNLLWLLAGAVVAGGLAVIFGLRRPYPVLTVALAGYNLVSLGLLVAGAVVPRARLTGKSALAVFRQYAHESRRRFGSMIVHFGVVVIAVGVMARSAYRVDEQVRVDYGSSLPYRGYELRAISQFMHAYGRDGRIIDLQGNPAAAANLTTAAVTRVSAGSVIEVWRGGRHLTTLRPRINTFGTNPMRVVTPAVLYTPQHDLYLSLVGEFEAGQSYAALRIVQSPLVAWIWVGGLILALGTVYALLPQGGLARARREVPDGRAEA